VPRADGKIPLGAHLIGVPWQEEALFRAASALEPAGTCVRPIAPAFDD
jgi:Asp-tRNA(Asn)/Glu-tRNA(Gln) amidotransferase A subunit family amidase